MEQVHPYRRSRLFRIWWLVALMGFAGQLWLEVLLPKDPLTFNLRPVVQLVAFSAFVTEEIVRWRAEPHKPPEMD